MANQNQLLSEQDAARLARTTPATLQQFAAAGLLSVKRTDNVPFYNKQELVVLFHCSAQDELIFGNASPDSTDNSTEQGEQERAPSIKDQSSASPLISDPQITDLQSGDKNGSLCQENLSPSSTTTSSAEVLPTDSILKNVTLSDGPEAGALQLSSSLEYANKELSSVNQGLRDQIQILREERDWLRRRLETSESRIERDQILLISKSETIRQLVQDKHQPRGFWALALPWLKGSSTTINEK